MCIALKPEYEWTKIRVYEPCDERGLCPTDSWILYEKGIKFELFDNEVDNMNSLIILVKTCCVVN